ncbi:ribosomal-protein-L7/L12-serine acetyltransferase [compost metagenome]
MRYVHLQHDCFEIGLYKVTTLRKQDMLLIKQWRNEQMAVLRQAALLTDEDQLRYYADYVKPSISNKNTQIMLFSYFLNDELIGYGGLTNIDWVNKRAEISYLLDTERSSEENQEQYSKDFSTFLRLMLRIAFDELDIHRLYTETFDIRPLHIATLQNTGFLLEGRMKDHVYIDGRYVDSLLHGCIKENTKYAKE